MTSQCSHSRRSSPVPARRRRYSSPDARAGSVSCYLCAVGSLLRCLRLLWGGQSCLLGGGSVGRASIVTCERCRGRLPKRFSHPWGFWAFSAGFVFRIGWLNSRLQNPAYRRSQPTFCIPKTASCGPQIAVSASRLATAQGLADSIQRCRVNSGSLANLLCTPSRVVPHDARSGPCAASRRSFSFFRPGPHVGQGSGRLS